MTTELMGKQGVDIGEILNQEIYQRTERDNQWIVVEEYPEALLLGVNIRERDDHFVTELAASILSQGQIQECTGETLPDGTVRVWAGHHRFWAVQMINEYIDQHNLEHQVDRVERLKLRVRVRAREFTEDEILEIQIAENLHKNMRPEEEAEAINAVYGFYKRRLDGRGEKASVADFSRRIGLGEGKVGNAIKYIGLDDRVRELVEKEAIMYSMATGISRLPKDKQFSVAMKVILYNLDREQADILVRQTLGEDDEISLFSTAQWVMLERDNYRLAFRTAADRAAMNAAGYFRRVIRLLESIEEPERATMTDTIRDILSGFIYSAYYFRLELGGRAPQLLKELDEKVLQIIAVGGESS